MTIPYLDAQATVFGRTTLTKDLWGSFGYAFSPPNSIRFAPALTLNETRQVTGYGESGKFRVYTSAVSAYTTGTLDVTEGSTAVTGTSTVWITNGVGSGQVIQIAGVPYLIDTVSANTALTLTGPVS